MSKHTQGEWAVVEDRIPGSIEVFANGRAVAICEIWRRANPETEQANARLIAAAPDLLEAARAVVERWDSPKWSDGTHTRDYIDKLREAIKKAEGGEK